MARTRPLARDEPALVDCARSLAAARIRLNSALVKVEPMKRNRIEQNCPPLSTVRRASERTSDVGERPNDSDELFVLFAADCPAVAAIAVRRGNNAAELALVCDCVRQSCENELRVLPSHCNLEVHSGSPVAPLARCARPRWHLKCAAELRAKTTGQRWRHRDSTLRRPRGLPRWPGSPKQTRNRKQARTGSLY